MDQPIRFVDAHLDLAYNAGRGRDITRPAAEQPDDHGEAATVGLPDLQAAGCDLVCGTLFCLPQSDKEPGYSNAAGAIEQADKQLSAYETLEANGQLRMIRTAGELDGDGLGLIVLMEGADAMTLPGEATDATTPAGWFRRGVRMVGLAWQATRYTAGTGANGPLTDDGRALVPLLDEAGFIHDASHLAEAALDELLDLASRPICASHSNCRSIVGEDPAGRHLPNRQIEALTKRGGVIGVVFYDRFLLPPAEKAIRRANFSDVLDHIARICDLAGDARHVGIGSDFDGGFGNQHVPEEMTSAADLPKLADALASAGFSDADIRNICGDNWRRFFLEHLPSRVSSNQ